METGVETVTEVELSRTVEDYGYEALTTTTRKISVTQRNVSEDDPNYETLQHRGQGSAINRNGLDSAALYSIPFKHRRVCFSFFINPGIFVTHQLLAGGKRRPRLRKGWFAEESRFGAQLREHAPRFRRAQLCVRR